MSLLGDGFWGWEWGGLDFGGDIHWAAIITSGAAIFAAIGVIFAAYQVNEARRSRHAAAAADFSRRWDETDMIRSRQLARQSKTPDDLRRQFMRAWTNLTTDDYLVLQIVPNYLEDLAILLKQGAIHVEFAEPSLGDIVRDTWKRWKPAAEAWAGTEKRAPWPNFQEAGEAPDLTELVNRGRRRRR